MNEYVIFVLHYFLLFKTKDVNWKVLQRQAKHDKSLIKRGSNLKHRANRAQ